MNVMPNINNNNTNSSAYLIEFSNIWNGRLGHVSFQTIKRVNNLNQIPSCAIDLNYKCESKLTKEPFQSLDRNTQILYLNIVFVI